MPIRLLTAALIISFVPTSLSAAGFYLGAGIGPEVEAGVFRRELERFAEADGGTWKLFGGVELGRHWALEAATLELGDQRCCGGNVADLGFTSLVGGYSLAALGRWPVGHFVPFLKVGLLFWGEDGEFVTLVGTSPRLADGTDLLLGAGLEVQLSARFGIRAEWERYEFDGATSDSVTASLVVRFRRSEPVAPVPAVASFQPNHFPGSQRPCA